MLESCGALVGQIRRIKIFGIKKCSADKTILIRCFHIFKIVSHLLSYFFKLLSYIKKRSFAKIRSRKLDGKG